MHFGKRMSRQILALSISLTTAVGVKAETQYPNVEETNRIAHSLLTVLRNCPDRIWPDLKFKNLDMLLMNKELSRQIVVSPKNNTLFTLANETLPAHIFSSAFSLIPFNDGHIMHVDSQIGKFDKKAPSQAFELAVHEAFHYIDQSTWIGKSNGRRGTTIPLIAEPRIARNMLYRSLLGAYHQNSDVNTYLGKARYWYDQWLQADPAESASTTDGYEGTARYVEAIASLFNSRSCGATEQELKKLAVQTDIVLGKDLVGFHSADSEGYHIGGLASLILRFQFPSLKWQERVAQGETPVEILLKNIRPIENRVDPLVEKNIRKAIKDRDIVIDSYLASTRDQMRKENSIYVNLPSSSLKGSFSPKGFFNSRDTGMSYTPMAAELTFKLSDGYQLKSEEGAVFMQFPNNTPCGDGWSFVIADSAIRASQTSEFEIRSSHFNGQLRGVLTRSEEGHRWLCVSE